MVEDGDILSPPYPPLKRGWKKGLHPLLPAAGRKQSKEGVEKSMTPSLLLASRLRERGN